MNNGYNGTGTAFILYIILAFCMPIVYVYRLTKRRRDFDRGFVFGHFALGMLVTVLAVVCVSYLWRIVGVPRHGLLHHVLVITAYCVLTIVIIWVLIPRWVRGFYRLRHKKYLLNYRNPHIHPWIDAPHYDRLGPPPRRKIEVRT
jgi:amino acid transporter